MTKKNKLLWPIIPLLLSLVIATTITFSQEEKSESKQDSLANNTESVKKTNRKCFICHGNKVYTLRNPEDSSQIIHRRTYQYVDSAEYYVSNHRNLGCNECHSSDFEKFPHNLQLRFENPPNCMDCHSDGEKFAFSKIETDFKQSVHHLKMGEGFSCKECHNSHSYKINAHNRKSISDVVAYDNQICLSCHANFDKFKMLSLRDTINILKKHEWLPNQALHFKSVRCLECHAQVNDSLLVAHKILPKKQAVHRCVACHSKDSRLMQSLYSYKSEQGRVSGFENGSILKELYVIGANRNYYLNLISIILTSALFFGIFVHILLRIIFKKRKKK